MVLQQIQLLIQGSLHCLGRWLPSWLAGHRCSHADWDRGRVAWHACSCPRDYGTPVTMSAQPAYTAQLPFIKGSLQAAHVGKIALAQSVMSEAQPQYGMQETCQTTLNKQQVSLPIACLHVVIHEHPVMWC